jgi:hypothetical protein
MGILIPRAVADTGGVSHEKASRVRKVSERY